MQPDKCSKDERQEMMKIGKLVTMRCHHMMLWPIGLCNSTQTTIIVSCDSSLECVASVNDFTRGPIALYKSYLDPFIFVNSLE